MIALNLAGLVVSTQWTLFFFFLPILETFSHISIAQVDSLPAAFSAITMYYLEQYVGF